MLFNPDWRSAHYKPSGSAQNDDLKSSNLKKIKIKYNNLVFL